MKLSESQRSYIKGAFLQLQTKEDFLSLLNYSKVLIYKDATELFTLQQLNYHTSPNLNPKRYYSFALRKKSGGSRTIMAPHKGLKEILRALNIILQTIYDPARSVNGFVLNRSIVDNAEFHTGQQYVYTIDIKDFFSSIDQARIWGRMQAKPFLRNVTISNIIASLCCHEQVVERPDKNGNWTRTVRSVLPQGAPTSPTISNIICQQLDYYLGAVAKRFGLKYSRYADDITFSSMHNVYKNEGAFITEIKRILHEQRFDLNPSKTRLQQSGYKQIVTGLIVNEKVNVPKNYIKQIRQYLYLWEVYGYERANNLYNQNLRKITANKKNVANLSAVLIGKMNFLKMTKGNSNTTFMTLAVRLSKLTKYSGYQNSEQGKIILELKRKIAVLTERSELEHQHQQALELSKPIPLQHDPQLVVSLLNKFTEETFLKYTTHHWDKEAERSVLQRSTFQQELKDDLYRRYQFPKLQVLTPDLYWKIMNFMVIRNEKGWGWGNHRLNFGWYNQELIDFYINHPERQPAEFTVPREYLPAKPVQGKTLHYFEDFIDIFKNEIEFRDNYFHYMVKQLCDVHLGYNYNVSIEGLKGVNFYTDTQKIEEAFELVILNMKGSERIAFPKVDISGRYDEKRNVYIVLFEHKASFCNKPLNDAKLRLEKKGQLFQIRNKLISLCDWAIISNFRVQNNYVPRKLIYLSAGKQEIEDGSPFNTTTVEEATGFSHEFTFYL